MSIRDLTAALIGLFLSASVFAAGVDDGIGKTFKGHGTAPQKTPSDDAMQMYNPPAGPKVEATVLSIVEGSGYSYMEVEAKNKTWWIAGTKVNAKKGDRVRYDENVVMENFYSKTLNKTFDRIIFASSVEVLK